MTPGAPSPLLDVRPRPPEPAAPFLRSVALAPLAPAGLLLVAALLASAATQWPQADAPWPVTDGLTRSDLLAIEGLGLHRLGASVPVLLFGTATLLVALARGLLPHAMWQGRAELPLIQAALAPHLSGRWPLRVTRGGGLRAGLPDVGAWLLAAAAACAFAHVVHAATLPLPVLIDVPLGQADPATLEAWRVDAAALAPAPGRWRGRCARTGPSLRCSIDVPGARHEVTLVAGSSAQSGDKTLTWLDVGRSASAAALALSWQPPGAARPYLLTLQGGQASDVPALGLRLHPSVTRAAGPLVFGVDPARHALFALVSPVLAPAAPKIATATGPEVVRLQVAEAPHDALLAVALLLALAGAAAGWWVPGLVLRRSGHDRLVLVACNRAALFDRIRAIADASPPADSVPQVPRA